MFRFKIFPINAVYTLLKKKAKKGRCEQALCYFTDGSEKKVMLGI
jgi:hypothetical protein